jgi:hypothetical protein
MENVYVNELNLLKIRTFIKGFLCVGLGSIIAFLLMPICFGSFTTYQNLVWFQYVIIIGLLFGIIAGFVSCIGINKYIKRAKSGAPIEKLRGLITNIVNSTDVLDTVITTVYIKLNDDSELILQNPMINKMVQVGDLADIYVFLDKAPNLERLQRLTPCLVLSESEIYKYHDTLITKVK